MITATRPSSSTTPRSTLSSYVGSFPNSWTFSPCWRAPAISAFTTATTSLNWPTCAVPRFAFSMASFIAALLPGARRVERTSAQPGPEPGRSARGGSLRHLLFPLLAGADPEAAVHVRADHDLRVVRQRAVFEEGDLAAL